MKWSVSKKLSNWSGSFGDPKEDKGPTSTEKEGLTSPPTVTLSLADFTSQEESDVPRDPLPTASSFVRLRKAPYLKHPRSGCPSLTSFRSILFTSITALALRRSNISVAWSKLFHLPPRHSAIKIVQTFTVPLQKMWFEN